MTAVTDTPTLTAPQRARAFVDEILIPREVQAERAGGRLPKEEVELIRREALARGLGGGSPEQIERYVKPALRGELHDAYAVTEEHAGSDPSAIRTTATRTPSGW